MLVRTGRPIAAIEVKHTSTPKLTKGLLQSFADLATSANFIITPDTDDFLLREDVRACKLTDFLLHRLPIIITGE